MSHEEHEGHEGTKRNKEKSSCHFALARGDVLLTRMASP